MAEKAAVNANPSLSAHVGPDARDLPHLIVYQQIQDAHRNLVCGFPKLTKTNELTRNKIVCEGITQRSARQQEFLEGFLWQQGCFVLDQVDSS